MVQKRKRKYDLLNHQPRSNAGLFYCPNLHKKQIKINYKCMRLITEEVYAGIIKLLSADPKIALFEKLLMSQKIENEPQDKKTESEAEGEK